MTGMHSTLAMAGTQARLGGLTVRVATVSKVIGGRATAQVLVRGRWLDLVAGSPQPIPRGGGTLLLADVRDGAALLRVF